jgi:hypothetical protein
MYGWSSNRVCIEIWRVDKKVVEEVLKVSVVHSHESIRQEEDKNEEAEVPMDIHP